VRRFHHFSVAFAYGHYDGTGTRLLTTIKMELILRCTCSVTVTIIQIELGFSFPNTRVLRETKTNNGFPRDDPENSLTRTCR